MRHLFDTPLCASPFNRGAPKNAAPLMAAALPAMITAGSNLIGGAVNNIVNRSNMQYQADIAKDLAQYQWDNFNSYPAQVKSMLKAGLNPSAILGQGGSGTISGPSINMPTASPVDLGFGTSLSDIANYTLSLAQAKKAGVDTKNVEIDIKAKEFELELSKWFSVPAKVAEITSAWKNVMLQDDEHNIKEWQKVKEKTLAGLTGIQKEAAEKELANMDTVIDQKNRQREEDIKLTQEKQKTEGTQQSANRAAAKASMSQAELNQHQQELIDYQRDFQEMVNKVKRSNLSSEMLTNLKKLLAERHLSETHQKEAELRLSHVQAFINARNMSAAWREFDNACNWISSKISASISGSFGISEVSKD